MSAAVFSGLRRAWQWFEYVDDDTKADGQHGIFVVTKNSDRGTPLALIVAHFRLRRIPVVVGGIQTTATE